MSPAKCPAGDKCEEEPSEVFMATKATVDGTDNIVAVVSTCPSHASEVKPIKRQFGKRNQTFTLTFCKVVSEGKLLSKAILV